MTALEAQAPTPGAPEAHSNPSAEAMGSRVARNSLWLIGQPLLLNVISVLSTLYIARKLGAADYGSFNLGFAQISFFAPICILGLSGIAIRAIAQNRVQAREVTGTVLAARLMTTGAGVLLALGWLLLPVYDLTTRLIAMAAIISMACQACGSICLSLFQGFERSDLTARGQVIGGLVLTLLSVAALLLGLALPGLVAAYVMGAVFQLVLLLWMAQRHFFPVVPRWEWPSVWNYLRQTPPFAITDIVARVTNLSVLDVMILGAFFAPGVVGPYVAAVGLVARLAAIPCGIVDALYPAVAHQYRTDADEVRREVWRCALFLALATVPIAICLCVTAPTVLWLLFGSEYLAAAPALGIAAWLLPLGGAIYLARVSLAAVHRQVLVARLTVVSGVLTALLFGLLIPRFGMMGAATAMVIREVLMLALWSRPFSQSFGWKIPGVDATRGAVALAVMCVPLGLLLTAYSHLGAVVAGAAALFLYAVALVALRVVDPAFVSRRFATTSS